MIPAALEYVRAGSVEEALEALAEPDASVLAGGQSLVPALKLRIARPSTVVDVGGLDLGAIEEDDGVVEVGALATWDSVVRSDVLRAPGLAAVAECAALIGDRQVRNRGTIGGGLCLADPAADMPAVAVALAATLVVATREGRREIPAGEFFLGPFTTALGAGELLTAVRFSSTGGGSAYAKAEHPASGFALAGAAAFAGADGTRRVALTGVAGAPVLADDVDEAIEAAGAYGDRFAPAEYRKQLAKVMARRALELAERRARGEAA